MSDICGEPFKYETWTAYCDNSAAETSDGLVWRCEWCHSKYELIRELRETVTAAYNNERHSEAYVEAMVDIEAIVDRYDRSSDA